MHAREMNTPRPGFWHFTHDAVSRRYGFHGKEGAFFSLFILSFVAATSPGAHAGMTRAKGVKLLSETGWLYAEIVLTLSVKKR